MKKARLFTLVCLVAFGLLVHAANEKTTIVQVTDAVQLTTDVDYTITSETPFATTGSVDIVNTEHAVLIFSGIKPSKVLSSGVLGNVYINGENAVNGTNCQVKMYGRGTIVFPYASDVSPLTCYTEENYGGEACTNYSEGHSGGYMKNLTATTLNNQIRSFKLKRGYMVTFAIGTSGWGYSRCFVADQADLEVSSLPAILDKKISSYRLFKWVYAHKAGLASNGEQNANQALNTSWCYDWGQGSDTNYKNDKGVWIGNDPDTEWVPNHIYEDWPSTSACGSRLVSCHMKANNEPKNQSDDRPQELEEILGNWQNMMRTGMRLCTPSSWDGSDYWNGTGFVKTFLDSIDARGWRCDIVDAHCYWNEGNFANLKNYWYPNMHRPIWISEWIWGASWSGGSGAFVDGVTDEQILNTTRRILENLNSMDCVERYAYWNSERTAHIYENGELTALGKYYSTMDVGIGYKASMQYTPKTPQTKALGELSYSHNARSGAVTLTWTDPNIELTNTITVMRKTPEESRFQAVATVVPKDWGSSNVYAASPTVASYSQTVDNITESGVYSYYISTVTYDNKTYTSNTVNINVAPAQGTNKFQHGKLAFNTTDEITTAFSETFEETPYIFMGTMTYVNRNFLASNNLNQTSRKNQFKYTPLPWKTNTATLSQSKSEEIPFLALNEGRYQFDDLSCEVGTVRSKTSSDTLWTEVDTVVFAQPFPEGVTPIVLTELSQPSYTNTTALGTRIFDVTNTGFKFIIYTEQKTDTKVLRSQNVRYLAITPGIGTVNMDNVDGEENAGNATDIIIAAGHGVDSQIYGSSAHTNNFYLQSYDAEGDSIKNEPIRLYKPTILTALQTNNYPALCMLRRTDVTETDEDGTTWTTGTSVRRILDHNIVVDGKTITSTSTSESNSAYFDDLGWIAIAKYVKGSTAPTAIHAVPAGKLGAGDLKVRVIGRCIYVDGTAAFDVYNTAGAKVAHTTPLTPGIYVVKAFGKTVKVLVK